MIAVELRSEDPKSFSFRVRVSEGGSKNNSETSHDVTLSRKDYERLAKNGEDAASFVKRAFEFLLEREPKESILRSFDVSVISRYFDEFERVIRA
jgi:hypothetical protein